MNDNKQIDKFNTLLNEFMIKMINQYPDSEKLKNYHKAFTVFKITSPNVPVKLFMSGTINYKEKIINRDENFFLTDPNVSNLGNKLANFTTETGLSHYWNSMSSKTKIAIWDYIQSLFVLGEIIIKKDKSFKTYNISKLDDYNKEIYDINKKGVFSEDLVKKLNS